MRPWVWAVAQQAGRQSASYLVFVVLALLLTPHDHATDGFFISEERDGPFAGPDRIVSRLSDITERSSLEEVVGEFGQMSL